MIIIYYSQTGFTKKYAQIIAEELNCKIIEYQDIKKERLDKYKTIIFGTRIIAGKIEKLNKLKRITKKNKNQKLIIFTTGSTPNKAKNIIKEIRDNNFTIEEQKNIPYFHMQSGMNLEALPIVEKTMINMAKKMISKKKNKTKEDQEFEKAISNSFDISDIKYTKELIDYIKK